MNKEENKVVQSPQAEMPMVDRHHMWFLVGIPIIAILILGAFVGGMIWASNKTVSDTEDMTVDVEDAVTDQDDDGTDEADIDIRYSDAGGELSISWYTDAQRYEVDNLADYGAFISSPEDPEDYAVAIGLVEGGEYDGYQLILNMFQEQGMGSFDSYFYTLLSTDTSKDIVILDQYFSSVGGIVTRPADEYRSTSDWLNREKELLVSLQDSIVIDLESEITELEWADTMKDTSGISYETLGVWASVFDGYSLADHDVVGYTKGPGRAIYEVPAGESLAFAFLVERVDGRFMGYLIDIPFYEPESLYSSAQPDITWNDGAEAAKYVASLSGGCGIESFTNVIDAFSAPEFTRKTGVTAQGDDLSEPLPPDSYFDDMYDTWLLWNEEGTRDDFIALHPLFFWKDALGRVIQFTNVDIIPQGECGKPVIYLYPEETTHMVVEVDPQGGFTYTEPDYGDGWEVIAYPDGYVKNIADNEIYPYLFWEGRGGLYSEPANYWVVAQNEVEPFLVKTLARLGLQDREIAEFMEFWVPRMQAAEYYKIGFHGTEVMDAIAPITLSQEADSVLRILMDFSELDEREPSNPPRFIPHFVREGFSLVEWGGVIR